MDDFVLDEEKDELYTEFVGLAPLIAVSTILVGAMAISAVSVKNAINLLKSYEEERPDLIPVSQLTRKTFEPKAFETTGYGNEVTGKKEWFYRAVANKYVTIYFDGNTPIAGYAYDKTDTGYETRTEFTLITYKGISQKYPKYYFCRMMLDHGYITKDASIWLKDYAVAKKKGIPFNESSEVKEDGSVANMLPITPVAKNDILSKEKALSLTEEIDEEFGSVMEFMKQDIGHLSQELMTEAAFEVTFIGTLVGSMVISFVATTFIISEAKKTLQMYEKDNPDVIPLSKLERRMFDAKAFSDTEAGKEIDGKVKQWFAKLKCKYIYIYFDGKEPIVGVAVKEQGTFSGKQYQLISYGELSKKHDQYYLCAIMLDDKVISTDMKKWAKEYREKRSSKATTESVLFEEAAKVDDDIKPIIQKLNEKGYKTKYSCSGHPSARLKNDTYRDGILHGKLYSTARVVFAENYKLPSPPKYWEIKVLNNEKNVALYVTPPHFKIVDGLPTEVFNKWKKNYMNALTTWVNSLGAVGSEKAKKETTPAKTAKDIMESVIDDLIIDSL